MDPTASLLDLDPLRGPKKSPGNAQVAVLTNLCMDMGVQSRTVNCLLRCPSFRTRELPDP